MSVTSLIAKSAAWAIPFGAIAGFVAAQAVPPPGIQVLLRAGWSPVMLGVLQWVGCVVLFTGIGGLVSLLAAREDATATKRRQKFSAEAAAGYAMRCENCRAEISSKAHACPKCGHPGGGSWLLG